MCAATVLCDVISLCLASWSLTLCIVSALHDVSALCAAGDGVADCGGDGRPVGRLLRSLQRGLLSLAPAPAPGPPAPRHRARGPERAVGLGHVVRRRRLPRAMHRRRAHTVRRHHVHHNNYLFSLLDGLLSALLGYYWATE